MGGQPLPSPHLRPLPLDRAADGGRRPDGVGNGIALTSVSKVYRGRGTEVEAVFPLSNAVDSR